jgi:TRAP-type C4-dicarboxylate transport system substrate-binding protein
LRKEALLIPLALLLAISLVVVGCPATPTETSTPTPTETSTPTPTETSTPTPTEPILIRLACAETPVEPIIITLTELETTIPEETDGRVKFEIYPGEMLYSSADATTALQTGDLEMTLYGADTSFLMPEWAMLSGGPALFLFDDIPHFKRFLDTDAYGRLLARMEAMGIKPLTSSYLWGTEEIFNNKKPIEKLEDFQGIAFTCKPSPVNLKAIEALGATALSIPNPELPSALETGMVDGITVGFPVQLFMPINMIFPYVTRTGYPCYPEGVAVSAEWWETVPPDLQQTLQSIFEDALVRWEEGSWAECDTQFAIYEETPGNTVTIMSDAEKARCYQALQPLYNELKADPNIQDMLEGVEVAR